MENYKSISTKQNREKQKKKVREEILNGRYIVTKKKAKIISALRAIPKPNGKIRLIHDCSRPLNLGLNEYASIDKVRFQTVNEAVGLLKKGYFMAKVDLQSAYRSVRIHQDDYSATGLKFKPKGFQGNIDIIDTRLPFGAKRAPRSFHRITQTVRRMMVRRGFDLTVVYLDDWLIIALTYAECYRGLTVLLELLRELGFAISYSKVETPATSMVFLGINIDSLSMSISLPQEKVAELRELLITYVRKRHASKKQLQQLAGKLNWASQVVRGGRTFLRRILDSIGKLKEADHKVILSQAFHLDLNWWVTYMEIFHGKIITECFDRPEVAMEIDSCSSASGVVFGDDWLFADWKADCHLAAGAHINHKEAFTVVLAARRWGHLWRGKMVTIYTDNQAAMHMLNKGTTGEDLMMSGLRELFWLSVVFDFRWQARYLKGQSNIFADTISRLENDNYLLQWFLLNQVAMSPAHLDSAVNALPNHMSPASLLLLLPQIQRLGELRRKWMRR